MVLQHLTARRPLSILVGLAASVVAAGAFAQATSAAMIAFDNAGNYNGAIFSGNSGGSGFGAWVEGTSGNGSAGNFSDTSSKNISTSTKSWGTYANSYTGSGPKPRVDMTRPFLTSGGGSGGTLRAGQTFSVALQSDGIGNTGALGFSLQSSSPINQFTFEYDGSAGYDNFGIIDGSHGGSKYEAPAPGINFTDLNNGIIVNFTLVTATTYDLSVSPAPNNTKFSTANLVTNGTLPSGAINQVDLFDSNTAGNGYFNSLSISSVPEPATFGLMAVGGLALLLVGRRKTA